jgi:hypothetical protein
MPRIVSLLCAAIVPAMIGIAALTPALAQQAQTAGIVIFDLFTGDSVDPNPEEAQKLVDAVRRAQAPSDCPLGRITVFAGEGDELFQRALAAAPPAAADRS